MDSARPEGIISHWDIDGLASAVLVARYLNVDPSNIRLSSTGSVEKFVKELFKAGVGRIFVLDLNPDAEALREILKRARSRGRGLVIIDHHEWPIDLLELASSLPNVKLVVDPTASCTAELVKRELLHGALLDEFHDILVRMAIDDDSFSNKLPLTPKWRVLLRWEGWDLRYRALEAWLDGILWPDWAEEKHEKIRRDYEKLLAEAAKSSETVVLDDTVLLFAYPDQRVHPSDLHRFLEEGLKRKADLYVFIYGRGVSMRSDKFDVSTLARLMGGGGHKRAAGARLSIESAKSARDHIVSLFSRILKPKR